MLTKLTPEFPSSQGRAKCTDTYKAIASKRGPETS